MRDRSRPSLFVVHTHGHLEPRVDPAITVRQLDPGQLRSVACAPRCVRCGGAIDGEPTMRTAGPFHDVCAPAVAAPAIVLQDATPRARRAQLRDLGPRCTHLTGHDQDRVLTWLHGHGPATSRMVAWALGLPDREIQLQLRALEGRAVEAIGVVRTGRRGHPPTVWRVREAVAA